MTREAALYASVGEETLLREIRRLHGIIAERDELIIQLQDELAGRKPLPLWLPTMTKMQRSVLRLLMDRAMITPTSMRLALHGGEERHDDLLKVFVFQIRKRIEPIGLSIRTQHAEGYYLPAETRARLKQETITWPLPSSPALSRRKSARPSSPTSASPALPIPSPSA